MVQIKYLLKNLDNNFWSFFSQKVQILTDFTKNPLKLFKFTKKVQNNYFFPKFLSLIKN